MMKWFKKSHNTQNYMWVYSIDKDTGSCLANSEVTSDGQGKYLFVTRRKLHNENEYFIRSYYKEWLDPIAGPFKTLKAAKAACLVLGTVVNRKDTDSGLQYNFLAKKYQVRCLRPQGYFPFIDNLVDGNDEFNVWLVTQLLLQNSNK